MTEVVEVATGRPYRVTIGRGVLGGAAAGLGHTFLLSDETVLPLHGARLVNLHGAARMAIAPGEGAKSFEFLEVVLDAMVAADLDRGATLVALGGGVVGDLGGLAAALFMRGIDWVACPTTLLAMVDASVGGKTAVNLAAGKNLAGSFHQPRAVFADLDTLATLPPEELRSGLGEALKTVYLAGDELLEVYEVSAEACARGDGAALAPIIAACVRKKADLVSADELESGPRRALNLGHTTAHAIEQVAGYGLVRHGVAVAAGIGCALRVSAELGLLTDPALPARHAALTAALGLPADLAALRAETGLELEPAALVDAMRHDKKGSAGTPELVLPVAAGRVELGTPAEPALLKVLVG